MINKILIVGDIHFGIDATERLYTETQQILHYLNEHEINLVVLNGDYFDSELLLSSKAGLLAVQFWSDLLDICREKNIKIRSIEGTTKHDRGQFQALSEFIIYDEFGNPDVDFKYIKTAQTEDLDGMHILYVPEEYPENGAEYYDEFRKDQYDVIFLHGMWDFTGLEAVAKNASKAPFFNYDDWKYSLEHGVAISSHYHGRMINKDGHVVYIGSFTAWKFDYETDRGFCYLEIDTDQKLYKYDLITNKMAPKYRTILGTDLPVSSDASADDLKLAIDSIANDSDYLRVDMTGFDSYIVLLLKQAYKTNNHVKIKDNSVKAKMLHEATIEGNNSNVNSQYLFVLDQSLDDISVISKFIETKNNQIIDNKLIEYAITPNVEVADMIAGIETEGATNA